MRGINAPHFFAASAKENHRFKNTPFCVGLFCGKKKERVFTYSYYTQGCSNHEPPYPHHDQYGSHYICTLNSCML